MGSSKKWNNPKLGLTSSNTRTVRVEHERVSLLLKIKRVQSAESLMATMEPVTSGGLTIIGRIALRVL